MKKLFLLAIILLSFSGCVSLLETGCNNAVKAEMQSADKRYQSTVFERDCGATTDFSTVVNLRSSSSKFDGDEGIVFVAKGLRQVRLRWKNDADLRIECLDCADKDIYKKETSWNNIRVSY
jgi:hypothetical protein